MSNPNDHIGLVLANTNSPCYTEAGGDRFPRGQCTWYATGRAAEKYGVPLASLLPAPSNAGDWYHNLQATRNVTRRPASLGPIVDSVAVLRGGSHGYGHVLYIEAVRSDYTYFTEWNWNQSLNGKLQRWSTADFAHVKAGFELAGYIVVRH